MNDFTPHSGQFDGTRRWFSCLWLMGIFILSGNASAELTGDLSLLSRVAELQQQNISRIRQWAGDAELSFHSTKARDDYELRQQVRVRFAYDTDRPAECFSWVVDESFARMRGQEDLVNSLQGHRAGALTVGGIAYVMHLRDYSTGEFTISLTDAAQLGGAHRNIGGLSQVFYPMSYFDQGNLKRDKFFEFRIGRAHEEWMENHITQDGDLVHLDAGGTNYPVMRKHYVFDLSRSGLLVDYMLTDGERTVTQVQEYEDVAGIFVPIRTVYRNILIDGTETGQKIVQWNNHKLNEPIPDASFTLEAMGVPAGTTVIDMRTRQTFQFNPASANADPVSPEPSLQHATAESPDTAGSPADTIEPAARIQPANWWRLLVPVIMIGGICAWWIGRIYVAR